VIIIIIIGNILNHGVLAGAIGLINHIRQFAGSKDIPVDFFITGVVYIQRTAFQIHIVELDESGYFLSEVPVSLGAGWMVAINILFTIIILAVTYLATSIVGRIKVADAIKYN
jgi:ABC-type lipoprotein release transport system permease subunit